MNNEDQLTQIGDLYEEGKDRLNSIHVLNEDRPHWSRCYDIIRELRDIAATQWKQLRDKSA